MGGSYVSDILCETFWFFWFLQTKLNPPKSKKVGEQSITETINMHLNILGFWLTACDILWTSTKLPFQVHMLEEPSTLHNIKFVGHH